MSIRKSILTMGLIAACAVMTLGRTAQAGVQNPDDVDILFCETFDCYDDIFNPHRHYDEKAHGLPMPKSWGGHSDELWYGARFEKADDGTIDQDLAVQEIGGSGNHTPVGRFEDEAGLMFRIDTRGYESVKLCFDWRTYAAEHGDKFRAGYFVGDLGANLDPQSKQDLFVDFRSRFNSGSEAEQWWNDNWTKLVAGGRDNSFNTVMADLPTGEEQVWVAFWLDGSEGDYGKIDNIKVKGVVPEPASLALLGLGAMTIIKRERRR